MHRKIAFTALSLAVVFGASTAMAAGKKHNAAHEAYASGAVGQVADPRQNKGANHESLVRYGPAVQRLERLAAGRQRRQDERRALGRARRVGKGAFSAVPTRSLSAN